MPDDHNLEEQLLLNKFRRLDAAGKMQLLKFAASLLNRLPADGEEPPKHENQCRLDAREERPEAAEEPIFTE